MSAEVPLPPCLAPPVAAAEPETAGVAWDERHLQCIWADARLRPPLVTTGGLPVRVLDPGRRTGGPGPDFRGATLEIGGHTRKGDVEIHVRPGDWNLHGHSDRPDYDGVVLHVAWFPPAPGEAIPDVPLALLRDAMQWRPGFSFDQIDPSAYPHPEGSDVARPCRNALASARPDEVAALLECAGRARARRLSDELAGRMARAGSREQGFYAEVLAALGYRRNAAPMRALAATLPVAELAAEPDPMGRYALLLGRAGLLPKEGAAGLTEAYVARVWGAAFRAGATSAEDAAAGWTTAGVRPLNHPRVRLAVAAALFRTPDGLLRALEAVPREDPRAWVRGAAAAFADAARGAGEVLPPRMAALPHLLGRERVHAILVNVVLPLFAREDPAAARLAESVPGEALSAPMRETAFRLLGGDHNPALYAGRALRMQGLLELWRGFCEASPEACRDCPLARR